MRNRRGGRAPIVYRVVSPLGMASKGDVWYPVADTDAGLRTFRVDRVTAVEIAAHAGDTTEQAAARCVAIGHRLVALLTGFIR